MTLGLDQFGVQGPVDHVSALAAPCAGFASLA